MRFYVNDKEYNLDYAKMQKQFISSGYESDVYKFGNNVYKFYKEICLKYRLDEENTKRLSKIQTKRILLPKDVIYDENHDFFGYTMRYIKPIEKEEISDLKMEKILKELQIIKKDLLLLKENNIFIDDLCDGNFIYNKGIYFVDPGSYEYNKERSKEYIEIINREIMNDFIIKFILFRGHKFTIDEKRKINEHYPLNEYINEILKKDSESKELVKEYSKRIINNL